MGLTGRLGADVAIEAVGIPATFELCADLVRPGGRVANVGVHGHPATLHLERLWIRNITITIGPVGTRSTSTCCGWSPRAAWTRGRSPPTASPTTRSWTPTACSPTPLTNALKMVLTRS